MNDISVYFYIPKKFWPSPFPAQNDLEWEGFKDGIYCWTLQTYFRLKDANFDCELVSELPDSGIILAHRGCLDDAIVPNQNQLLVCMQADWDRHPFAQCHIVQNPFQTEMRYTPILDRLFSPGSINFVRLWPQPGLKGRDPLRGDQLKHIAYFGRTLNLADELESDEWSNFITSLGLKWSVFDDPERWKDYSDVDATISIRSFQSTDWYFKPATKLYNSWNASVVPICGPESAFLAEQKDKYDCIIVKSLDDLKAMIEKLVTDKSEFKRYQLATVKRANDICIASIVNDWSAMISGELKNEFLSWTNKSSFQRMLFVYIRKIGKMVKGIKKKILSEE